MKPISFTAFFLCLQFIVHAQSGGDSADHKWSGAAEADYYIIPGEKTPPTITAYVEHNSWHFETRYNYEDINSFSEFAGYNIEKDFKKGSLAVTPMFGAVAGKSNGLLPGLEITASYSNFNFYSENEYMFDFKGKQDYYFYSWTELSKQVIKNFNVGGIIENLRWYKTNFDTQKGVYAEYNLGNFTLDAYYLNPFSNSSLGVISLIATF